MWTHTGEPAEGTDTSRGSTHVTLPSGEGARSLPRLRVWLLAVCSGLLSLVAGMLQLRVSAESIRLPWDGNDAVALYGFTSTMTRFGWFSWNPDIGYPYGMDHGHFPTPEIRMWGLLKVVTLLSSDAIISLNVLFLLGYFLVGACSFLLFHTAVRRDWLAVVLAIATATIPWHVDRFRHVLLADYSAVPIGLLLTYLLWRGWWRDSTGRLMLAMGAGVYIGTGGVYYSFYSLLALCPVLAWRIVRTRKVRYWWRDALVAVTIPVSLAVSLLAHRALAQTAPVGQSVIRDPRESFVYAGDLPSLLLPWPLVDGAVGPGSLYLEGYALYGIPGVAAVLAALAALGWYLWVGRPRSRPIPDSMLADELTPWLRLFAWMLLWFTPGVGLLFALIVSPGLRSWGRISIVLLYIASVILGVVLRSWTDGGHRARGGLLAAVLVVMLGLQAAVDHRPLLASWTPQQDRSAREFASAVEEALPDGCPVMQIPLLPFPEGFPPPTPAAGVYDHMWLHVYAPTQRWSFGSERGTEGGEAAMQRYPRGLAAEDAISRAVEDGYCAVIIDLQAMTAESLSDFEDVLGPPTVAIGRWQFHQLDSSATQ